MTDKPITDVRLQWREGNRFQASDVYEHTVTVDAPTNEGDVFGGFKPGEMFLTSLAGCSGIDVIQILQRQRQNVTALEINVKGAQNPEAPWPYVTIEMEYVVKGKGLKEPAVKRAIHLSEAKYCSIAATISKDTQISSTFRIEEDNA